MYMSFFSNFFKKKENDQPVATVSFSEKEALHL